MLSKFRMTFFFSLVFHFHLMLWVKNSDPTPFMFRVLNVSTSFHEKKTKTKIPWMRFLQHEEKKDFFNTVHHHSLFTQSVDFFFSHFIYTMKNTLSFKFHNFTIIYLHPVPIIFIFAYREAIGLYHTGLTKIIKIGFW